MKPILPVNLFAGRTVRKPNRIREGPLSRLLKKAAFGDARADAAAFGLGQCGFSLPMMV
jgi:hypothetical protein